MDEEAERVRNDVLEIQQMIPADLTDDDVLPPDVQDKIKAKAEEMLRQLG